MLAFGGTRTYHRLACGVEDAGFEIRDQIQWIYGSGFPKSLDVSKGIDKAAGVEREVVGVDESRLRPNRKYKSGAIGNIGGGDKVSDRTDNGATITKPATPEAEQWEGWGTALKPAHEPIVVARKPLIGTVVKNVLKHGTGAINIDGCRVETETTDDSRRVRHNQKTIGGNGKYQGGVATDTGGAIGRWPSNVILTHHPECEEDEECHPDCPVQILDEQSGESTSVGGMYSGRQHTRVANGPFGYDRVEIDRPGGAGGASRFFYCAKASNAERSMGVWEGRNDHPTVKPVALMRYLCRLVTLKGGVVLDMFCGSGTTLVSALEEGFDCIGIDEDVHYCDIAEDRAARACRRLMLQV